MSPWVAALTVGVKTAASLTGYESAVTRAYLPHQTNSSREAEKTSVPRAPRLILRAPVRYRAKGLGRWHAGLVENLSQSGVVLRGAQYLPDYTLVEMVFEMPGRSPARKIARFSARAGLSDTTRHKTANSSAWPHLFSTTNFSVRTDRLYSSGRRLSDFCRGVFPFLPWISTLLQSAGKGDSWRTYLGLSRSYRKTVTGFNDSCPD
jgi:hypothetical protein